MRNATLMMSLLAVAQLSLAKSADSGPGAGITLVDGYALVQTDVNGHGPFRLLIDTGACKSALTPEAAAAAGIDTNRPSGRQQMLTTLSSRDFVPVATVSISIGQYAEFQSEVVIHRMPGVVLLGRHVDGILGQNALASQPFLLDFRNKRLFFGTDAVLKVQKLGSPTRIIVDRCGRVIVPVEINGDGIARQFLLDSGANQMLVACDVHCPSLVSPSTNRAWTSNGIMFVQEGRIGRVTAGLAFFSSVKATIGDRARQERDGLFPANWLAAVYVDVANKLTLMVR